MASNMPMDRFAREVLTAEGPVAEVGPAAFYRVVTKPGEAASTLSQVFLGVRIACAECHHHPFDRWSQARLLRHAGVLRRGRHPRRTAGEFLGCRWCRADPGSTHGSSGGCLCPGRDDARPENGGRHPVDPRQALADWMTRPDNPWFARNLANRLWAHLPGPRPGGAGRRRSRHQPAEQSRAARRPGPAPGREPVRHAGPDPRHHGVAAPISFRPGPMPPTSAMSRTIRGPCSSASRPRCCCDMVCQTTGVPEKFPGAPAGTRAIQLWDSKVPHYFLKVFGRPEPGQRLRMRAQQRAERRPRCCTC